MKSHFRRHIGWLWRPVFLVLGFAAGYYLAQKTNADKPLVECFWNPKTQSPYRETVDLPQETYCRGLPTSAGDCRVWLAASDYPLLVLGFSPPFGEHIVALEKAVFLQRPSACGADRQVKLHGPGEIAVRCQYSVNGEEFVFERWILLNEKARLGTLGEFYYPTKKLLSDSGWSRCRERYLGVIYYFHGRELARILHQ